MLLFSEVRCGAVPSAVRYLFKTWEGGVLVNLFNQSVKWMVFRLSICFCSGRDYLEEKPMNHLITCECNNSTRSSSQQVGGITAVKTRDAILMEYLPNAVAHACIFVAIVAGMALFL